MCLNIHQKESSIPLKFAKQTNRQSKIVLVDRDKYIKKIMNFLNDKSKFQKTAVKYNNFLKFITSQENASIKFIKSLLTLASCWKKNKDI